MARQKPPLFFPRIHHATNSSRLLALAVVFAFAFLLFFEPWDGTGASRTMHFARTPSLALDGNLECSDEFLASFMALEALGPRLMQVTEQGHLTDPLPLGPSLLQAPFWLAANGIGKTLSPAGRSERFGLIHRLYVSFGSAFFGFLTLILCWRVCSRLAPAGRALAAVVLTFFGSGALYFSLARPGHTVVFAMFAVALFLYIVRDYGRRPSLRGALYIGMAGGLMLLCDWLTLPLLILPLFAFMDAERRRMEAHWKRPSRRSAEPDHEELLLAMDGARPARAENWSFEMPARRPGFWQRHRLLGWRLIEARRLMLAALYLPAGLLAFLVVFSPQLCAWQAVFGDWLVFPPSRLLPPDAHRSWALFQPRWIALLFSETHGLFHWYPLLAAAALGLVLGLRRGGEEGLGYLLATLGALYLYALPHDWGEQAVIGPGRVLALTPLFCVGTAYLIQNLRSPGARALLVGALSLTMCWNVVLTAAMARELVVLGPLGRAALLWPEILPAMFQRPLHMFADGLLMRFFTQGPAPLEPLLTMLIMILFFPCGAWFALRYLWPYARRFWVLRLAALAALLALLGVDFALLQARPPRQVERGNAKLHELIQWLEPTRGADQARRERFLQELAQSATRYPDNPLLRFQLAEAHRRLGYAEAARLNYKQLATLNYPAGSLGLLKLSDRPPLELLEPLRVRAANPDATEELIRAIAREKSIARARFALEEAFLPSHRYWSLLAWMADTREERIACLRRALQYHPLWYPAEQALWSLTRSEQGLEAEAVGRALENRAEEEIRWLEELQRETPEAFGRRYESRRRELQRLVRDIERWQQRDRPSTDTLGPQLPAVEPVN